MNIIQREVIKIIINENLRGECYQAKEVKKPKVFVVITNQCSKCML